jgi:DNA polymerase-1
MSAKSKLCLIDGSAIAYRAYYGTLRNRLTTSKGEPTGAIYAFITSIQRLINELRPDYLAVAFDAPAKTFRHELFAEYKSTREATPEDLVQQLPHIFDYIKASNIPLIIQPGYEADDIIGTLAKRGHSQNLIVYLVTGDKDLMQLITEDVFIVKPAIAGKDSEIIDSAGVEQRLGIKPAQIPDYLALIGDTSDNIPGIKGIGPAKAQPLLQEFGTLENLLSNVDRVANPRLRAMIQEGANAAKISKELATINTDLALDLNLEEFKVRPPDEAALTDLYRRLEFHSLLKQMQPEVKMVKPVKNYRTVQNLDEIRKITTQIKAKEIYALDLETTSLNPLEAEIVGVALSWQPNQGVYIPIRIAGGLFGVETHPELLTELQQLFDFENITICGQNLKYDLLVLKRNGFELKGKLFDTMLAAYLIQPDAHSYKLERLAQQYLNYTMQPIEELIGKGKDQITMDQVPIEKVTFYAAEDADVALQLQPILAAKLHQDQTWGVFQDIEIPLVPVLMTLEANGVFLDTNLLRQMSRNLDEQVRQLTNRIYELAGIAFNINSPKQLGEILFDKLNLPKIKGYSTDVTVLEKLRQRHPLPESILEYRSLVKLQNTYLDALPAMVNARTGRVHSSFNQTGTATGRLSSSDPNLQNIPIHTEIGRDVRKAFAPQQPDWLILSADYSQIELRIMAHLSRDPELVWAFQEDVDIHTRTAARVFGVAEQDVRPEMRRVAKVVNFGIMYGAGPFRMSEELAIPQSEAKQLINQYFKTYPGINDYIIKTLDNARQSGYVKTLAGRLRHVADINSENRNIREAAERIAINMPIQGTAADMIKIAMIRIHKQLQQHHLQTMMILQIHDELLFEVPTKELESVKEIVKHEMENALPLSVPVKVDIGVGQNWFEAH